MVPLLTPGSGQEESGRETGAPVAPVLQRDGKVVVNASDGARSFLVRYSADGKLHHGFGVGGKAFTDFGSPATANALAIYANGKIVVAGSRGFNDFAVARYASSGRPDGSF